MSERCCRYDNRPLVRGEKEPNRNWVRRRYCNKACKYAQAKLSKNEWREIAREMPTIALVPNFAPHEIVPRDGGYMTRIDRALPERSMTGSTSAWVLATGGE